MLPDLVPLASLQAGQLATVARLELPEDTRDRLFELGLLAGTAVRLERFAPLGDPVEIAFRGSHLTLRRHEADLIWVRPAA
ncbi:MAG: FeoA family protein [Limisphaerales bacterium]